MADFSRTHRHTFIGFILILLGILFLLSSYEIVDLGRILSRWWPVILIIIGLHKMVTSGSSRYGAGFFLFIIGIFFLLIELGLFSWSVFRYIWPIIIILIGIKLILSPRHGLSSSSSLAKDTIDAVAIFGGTELSVTSQELKGGQATALFGGAEINLSTAKLKEGKATIHATALFGGVEIVVPEGWRVDVEGTPFFGALESKCRAPEAPDAPTLVIKGSAVFGAVEVRH